MVTWLGKDQFGVSLSINSAQREREGSGNEFGFTLGPVSQVDSDLQATDGLENACCLFL